MFKPTASDRVFQVINTIFLLLILAVVIYPLVFVLSASVSEPEMLLKGEVWLFPKGFTLDSYRRVFQNRDILIG